MNNLSNNRLNILDLPDEILCLIIGKLNMVDVFYSLVNVNQRFNRLVLDSLYIHNFNMRTIMNIDTLYDQTSLIDPKLLSRICKNILPKIHSHIHTLTVEECSMKQILLASNYPQLDSLSLINFQEEMLYEYLTDNLIFRDLLAKQIRFLNIDMKKTRERCSKTVSNIFKLILSLCKNLIVLNFCNMFLTRKHIVQTLFILDKNYAPSALTKLKINVPCLTDCLCLLDGPLVCLSTLIIKVSCIYHPDGLEAIDPTKKLPNLKCFSFTSFNHTHEYNNLIVPLLCRMINLEELKLYLIVRRYDLIYIDGYQLYDEFLIYMTQLKKFTFYIKTEVVFTTVRFELPTNEDIQRSFIGRKYPRVTSHVYTQSVPFASDGVCHIYSHPYDFEYFVELDNSFQGGMFKKVRLLKMCDRIPFEHNFFELISQDFPFLEFLYIDNDWSQKDNQHSSKLIKFPYLTYLSLEYTHFDYAKLFLLKQNMYLPRLLNLSINYKSLITITNNFTTDPTCFNFDQLKSLGLNESYIRPENFHQYFPLL